MQTEKFPDSMWTTLAPEELELCLTFKRQWKNCISLCQNNQSRNIRGKLVKVAHVKWHHRREPRNHLSQNWSYKSMPSAPPSNNRLNIISLICIPFQNFPHSLVYRSPAVPCCDARRFSAPLRLPRAARRWRSWQSSFAETPQELRPEWMTKL